MAMVRATVPWKVFLEPVSFREELLGLRRDVEAHRSA